MLRTEKTVITKIDIVLEVEYFTFFKKRNSMIIWQVQGPEDVKKRELF